MSNIAIVGMACRFPGTANDLDGYWDLLVRGECAISEIPQERWSLDGFYDPRPDIPTRSYSKWGGFLEDVRSFDPAFFDLSPREAEAMDPQQRLLLEVAYEAAQDAAMTLKELRDTPTGVFIGASNIDYNLLQRFRHNRGDILAGTGNALSIIANRVSNTLNLTGPSLVTDTACSSSLVALDTACRHLRDGSCHTALVGGANVLLDPRMFITFSRAHMLSPTGQISAFDAQADGFVRGEGVGLIMLKRLEDAEVDGNKIYATVEATAINQDGGTGTITAPNPDAQVAMMRSVLARSNAQAADITFAEAHGTGTSVGDPIEVNAIGTVFGGSERMSPLLIGSSKTNLGHLEPAAGIAGLIKTALALSHGTLPPTVGFETPNPKIDFAAHNVEVVHDGCKPLPNTCNAVGLVNSFGFGGTNACALVKAHKTSKPVPAFPTGTPMDTNGPVLQVESARAFPLSAPTEEHLRAYAGELAREIENGVLKGHGLAAIANALGTQRDHFEHRSVIVCNSHMGLVDRLKTLSRGEAWPRDNKTDPPGILTGHAVKPVKLAFTMTGQGGQWWAMGRDLLLHNPMFRAFFETFDAKFKPLSGWSVIDAMMADENTSELDDAAITPAVMFAFQCGLAEIWRSVGVKPDLVVGHSFGEVTAAYLAGGISLDHVAKLVMYRGLIRGDVDRVGTMAAIGLSAENIQSFLPVDRSVEIGGYNSPNLVTLTGEEQAIDNIIATIKRDNPDIVTRKLALDFAYHSSWFEPVEDLFKENVGQLEWSTPDIPVISTVTGEQNETFDADYWWSNLRYPVRYQDGINRALEMGATTFIELGPTRTLSSMTAGCAAQHGIPVTTVSTLQRRWDDFESIATAIGELYCSGPDVDWSAIHPPAKERIELPRQPWLNEHYWHAPHEARLALKPEHTHPLLGLRTDDPGLSWTQYISLETHSFLSDHRIDDQVVYPAACYLEAIYEAGICQLATAKIDIRDAIFHAALYINPGDEIELRTVVDPALNRIEIHSRKTNEADRWVRRASGTALPYETQSDIHTGPHNGTKFDTDQFYDEIAALGYQYGSRFKNLDRILVDGNKVHAQVTSVDWNDGNNEDQRLPAPLLDASFQLMLASSELLSGERSRNNFFLPTKIERITITNALRSGCSVSICQHQNDNKRFRSCDFDIRTKDGAPCITVSNLHACPIPSNRNTVGDDDCIYREELVDWSKPEARPCLDSPWLVLSNQCVECQDDISHLLDTVVPRDRQERTIETATQDWKNALQAALQSSPPLAGIIYKPDFASEEVTSLSDVTSKMTCHARELLALGRAMQDLAPHNIMPRIWTLIRSPSKGVQTCQNSVGDLEHATLSGTVRTIQMECPELNFVTITLENSDRQTHERALEILHFASAETEFIVRNDKVRVPRLRIVENGLKPRTAPVRKLPDSIGFKLVANTRGGLDTLKWQTEQQSIARQDQVQVEVTHVGLNFRDIMAATGALAEDAEPSPAIETLGLEFGGCVVGASDENSQLTAGDRVFGMARGALKRRINLSPDQLFRIPENLTNAEAATLCSAYLTAEYALNHIGRLAAGEKILIHNGTGAVGLAAITLARACGAEIHTTAGQQKKRDHLRELGLTNVYDSRALSFSDEILKSTGGYGVDVVLNALPGPYIDNALRCLAPYGRFLEIGKSDVYADRALGLKSLRANQSFHVIDVAAMLQERPDFVRRIMQDLLPRFASGEIAPLPHKVYPAHHIENAFRHFAAADHIGKVVIDQNDPKMTVHIGSHEEPGIDPQGTYLVTGGTRGMGLEAAGWLRANGAGHVVALSRTGRTKHTTRGEANGQQNDRIPHEFCELDVTNEAAVRRKIEQIQESGKPLKGVIHAAVVYDDAVICEMTDIALERAILPKVQGGLNLTRAILDTDAKPDFFLSFSSAAHVTGWPGQSNYTAANSALEGLTHWQRSHGIRGQCIHWGVFGDTGHVSESDAMTSYLTNAGWGTLSNTDVCNLLATILNSDETVLTVTKANWASLAARHSPIAKSPRLSELCLNGAPEHNGRRVALTELNGDMPLHALRIVREQVAKVLRVDLGTLSSYDTISDAGIDSLSAFELRNRLEQETNFEISLGRFVSASRFDELAELLCSIAREQVNRTTTTS